MKASTAEKAETTTKRKPRAKKLAADPSADASVPTEAPASPPEVAPTPSPRPNPRDARPAGRAAVASRRSSLGIPKADIDVTNVLNVKMAEENRRDEGHMCPLQLDVIDRLVRLYSNPGEVLWVPFGGIASEGVGALRARRRTETGALVRAPRRVILTELKREYFELAAMNLRAAEPGAAGEQSTLFAE
jgi:hypothetical protein